MGMMSALTAAVSGLRATQAGIDVVAQNVANADSVGYTRRRIAPVQAVAGEHTNGVRAGEVERVLDRLAQRQLRLETSGAAYTGVRASFATSLDRLFGPPGSTVALDGAVNGFTEALKTLLNNPADYSARSNVLDRGATLAGRIAGVADGVQALRSEAEGRIGAAVTRANDLLSGIAAVSQRIVSSATGATSPALLDERDRMVTELSALMDVQTVPAEGGSIRISTTAGATLFDGLNAARLAFDGRSNLTPEMRYSLDPAERGVGTITATFPGSTPVDLVGGRLIRSGEIAAALELRDETLVQAQRQLDELAAGVARSLSDRAAPVTPTAGGVEIDLTGLQAGNQITLDLAVGGAARRVIVVPTRGGAPATIPPEATQDPAATVLRLDISGGVNAGTAAALQAALADAGIDLGVTSPGTGRLAVANGAATVLGAAAGITVTGLQEGVPQLPFFVDGARGNVPFTGSFEGRSQLDGFAQRMAVNPALAADRSRLVVYGAGVPQGDTARPQALVDALTSTARTFSAASGIGGIAAPYVSTVADFARRVVETQGAAAESAGRLNEGQRIALATVEQRFAETSGVNIDQEMSQLVALQTAYGANARVMTAVRDMLDMLLRI